MAKKTEKTCDNKAEDKKMEPMCCAINNRAAGLFIPAGLFLGFAAGFIFNNIPAGIFGGLGVGFLMFAIIKLCCK